jgi:hypothetical protein
MRLLDEQEVIKAVDRHTSDDGTLDNDITCIFEEVPTAYDVDKVVEQLSSIYLKASDEADVAWNNAIDKAIEIVKADGVENE